MQVKSNEAFGNPGIEPRWTYSDKSGVGTAFSGDSHLWFTIWNGIVTEVYFSTVDRPQVRDLQFLITDGKTFFHEEKRDLTIHTERLSDHALGYRCMNRDREERYCIEKQIIANPESACLLQYTKVTSPSGKSLAGLKLYALLAPHLEVGGYGNNGYVFSANGQTILMAKKGGKWLALGLSVPFSRVSCGFVGESDGWTDLHQNFQMDWTFTSATDGNIALTGEIDLAHHTEFTLALALGNSEHRAISNLLQSLGRPFSKHIDLYIKQWNEAAKCLAPLAKHSFDRGNLYNSSFSVLLTHEDKAFRGALIASLAIPWGQAKGDDDLGGYHLVWTRDMVNSAIALLASGELHVPFRALIYLSVSQNANGGFAQNFWVDGQSYWTGVQLDETAFPIMLAYRLFRANALQDFDPTELIRSAVGFLIRNGPVTGEERWEEASGYSPSTLAASIAGLICAAVYFRAQGDQETARFLEEHADYVESHLEQWTVTETGSLVPGISRYYMRLLPEKIGQSRPAEDKESRVIHIANLAPDQTSDFLARNVVDGGFLELVRYGIRKPDDPVIVNTVKVIDQVLKTDTPAGPTWHRYNHDGYGQQADGGPFITHGVGRVWPLLTGERGHYEIAAGRDPSLYIKAMEGLASSTGLLPEQSWDAPDIPEKFMFLGKPAGSAMPLMWAHAEYVKLLRSAADGKVYDLIPEVAERYLGPRPTGRKQFGVWKFIRQVRFIERGEILRVQADTAFTLHWSSDGWKTTADIVSTPTSLDIDYADIPSTGFATGTPILFTFHWTDANHWEGCNFTVTVR